eukprot:3120826-Ditylum_brightwellii.AAC.1
MPTCGVDRSIHFNNEARTQSCLREHSMQTDISHPLACITRDNNDSKGNDVCLIQDNNKTTAPRATKGKTLPVVEHIYNTRQKRKSADYWEEDGSVKARDVAVVTVLILAR